MRKTFYVTAIAAAGFAGQLLLLPTAAAETLEVPTEPSSATVSSAAPASEAPVSTPQRGDSQASVLSAYGEPQLRHPVAGGGSRRQPPIHRWDYAGFSVFFERTTVVDVVIKDQPAPLSHVEELQPSP